MLLDFPQTAAWLNCDQPTLLRLVEVGAFPMPAILADRLVRWSENNLEAWADSDCPTTEPPSEPDFIRVRVAQVSEDVEKMNHKPRKGE
jgi:predicted DNA-binding transcriptional regulator AlpA